MVSLDDAIITVTIYLVNTYIGKKLTTVQIETGI